MRTELKNRNTQKSQRSNRVRSKVRGTAERPRLSVHRSNKFYYAQIINDESGETIVASNTKVAKDIAGLAKDIADKAKKAKVEQVVFDRGGLIYKNNLAQLANALRESGLKF